MRLFIWIFALSALIMPGLGAIEKQSPVINDDGSVTFNYYAPDADEVVVKGSFIPSRKLLGLFSRSGKLEMEQNGDWWTATSPPLESDLYTYTFEVDDDYTVTDPLNPNVSRDIADSLSYFIVGNGIGEDYKEKSVPHGSIEKVWYPSKLERMDKRRMTVYLPAAYRENPDRRFPVLYLLHGSGGDEDAWTDSGRASQILDNLIAEGRCQPMIVVMPNGNVNLAAAPGSDPRNPDVKPAANNTASMAGGIESVFMDDVVGYIDSHYRTVADKDHRAIAGLSLGGLHTLFISLNNPQSFGYVGLFSAQTTNGLGKTGTGAMQSLGDAWDSLKSALPFIGGGKVDRSVSRYTSENLSIYNNVDEKLKSQFSPAPNLYYIVVGKDDFVKKLNDNWRLKLHEKGYSFHYNETDGGHTWDNWRKYLVDFLPRLFNNQPGGKG